MIYIFLLLLSLIGRDVGVNLYNILKDERCFQDKKEKTNLKDKKVEEKDKT